VITARFQAEPTNQHRHVCLGLHERFSPEAVCRETQDVVDARLVPVGSVDVEHRHRKLERFFDEKPAGVVAGAQHRAEELTAIPRFAPSNSYITRDAALEIAHVCHTDYGLHIWVFALGMTSRSGPTVMA
jgi:hypothetical protein